MHTAAVTAGEVSATVEDDRFKELLVVSRIVMSGERRSIGVRDIEDENSPAIEATHHRDVPFARKCQQISGNQIRRSE